MRVESGFNPWWGCLLLVALIGVLGWGVIAGWGKSAHWEDGYKAVWARADRLEKEEARIVDMAKALRVLYYVSDPEAEMLAREFRRAESDSARWELYAAVCRVESGFNPTLTSRANCKGLMQLSDSTAVHYAPMAGAVWRPGWSPWADALNVRVGCIYLRELVVKFGEEIGVKMYVAGEPRIKRSPGMPEAGVYLARVMEEKTKLKYVYAGIRAERNKCGE